MLHTNPIWHWSFSCYSFSDWFFQHNRSTWTRCVNATKPMSFTISCRTFWTFSIWKWIWKHRWSTNRPLNTFSHCAACNHGQWAENLYTIASTVCCSMSWFDPFWPSSLCKWMIQVFLCFFKGHQFYYTRITHPFVPYTSIWHLHRFEIIRIFHDESWMIVDKNRLEFIVFVINNIVFFLLLPVLNRIAEWNGVYGDGDFSYDHAYVYIVVINNISQMTAMYCLVLFYRANKVCYQADSSLNSNKLLSTIVFKHLFLQLRTTPGWMTHISSYFLSIFRTNWNRWNRYQNFCASKPSFSSRFCKHFFSILRPNKWQ